jgi:hypothetical protein
MPGVVVFIVHGQALWVVRVDLHIDVPKPGPLLPVVPDPGMGVSTDKIRYLILSKDAQPKIF